MSRKTGSALKGSVFVALDQAPVLCLCAEKMNLFSDVFSLCLSLSTSFWNELWIGFPSPPDLELLRIMIRSKWFFLTPRHTIELIDADPDRQPRCPPLQVIQWMHLILRDLCEAHFVHEPFVVTLGIQWVSSFSKILQTDCPYDLCVGLHLSLPRIDSFPCQVPMGCNSFVSSFRFVALFFQLLSTRPGVELEVTTLLLLV